MSQYYYTVILQYMHIIWKVQHISMYIIVYNNYYNIIRSYEDMYMYNNCNGNLHVLL